MHKQLWIGLAEVRPLPECNLIEGARGAYVHVMAWGNTAGEFRAAVLNRAAELGLVLVDLRETEPWAIRNSGDAVLRTEFYEMADRLETDIKQVAFGRFHAWLQDQPLGETTPSPSGDSPSLGTAQVVTETPQPRSNPATGNKR